MSSENASERFVIIRQRPCEQAPSTNAGDASSNNTSNEDPVIVLLQRSTWRKRPPPDVLCVIIGSVGSVVVMPQAILARRNRRCALSATDTRKPEEKDARGVTCFMEKNLISPREVVSLMSISETKFEVEKEEQYFAYVRLVNIYQFILRVK